jgi:glycosyltransferase involved in cell wall biosynthesis
MTSLSILVLFRGDAGGLRRSLDSLAAQTWTGTTEVIIGDDASEPARFAEVEVAAAASGLADVQILRNRTARGRAYTRNVLLDAAAGKYLTWCDAGDELAPDKVELQIQGLLRARYLELWSPMWCTANTADAVQEVDGGHIDTMMRGTLSPALTTMLGTTRSFRDVGYFDLDLPALEELDFCLRYATQDGHFMLPSSTEPLCTHQASGPDRDPTAVLSALRVIHRKHRGALLKRSRRYRRNRDFEMLQLAGSLGEGNRGVAAAYLGAAALRHPIGFARWLLKGRSS